MPVPRILWIAAALPLAWGCGVGSKERTAAQAPAKQSKPADEASLEFKDRGAAVTTLASSKLGPPAELEVWEPHEAKSVKYAGYRTAEVLEKAYGPAWKKASLVVFIRADGTRSPIPREKLESAETLLAASAPGREFRVSNRFLQGENVPLGPFYLVWDNVSRPELREEGAGLWPYQIVGIDLGSLRDSFPNIVPPEPVPASVQRGFSLYQAHCLSCHQLNGNGGAHGAARGGGGGGGQGHH
jgi:hypothetical protein